MAVQLIENRDIGEVLKSGAAAGDYFRDLDRKRKLQNLYSTGLNPDGSLPTEFLRRAAAEGLGEEGLAKYHANLTSNSGAATKLAEEAMKLEVLGRDPDAGREWNGKPQESQIYVPGVVAKDPVVDITGFTTPDMLETTKTNRTNTNTGEDGSVRVDAYIPQAPKDYYTTPPTVKTVEVPRYSVVEEMLRRKPTASNPFGPSADRADNTTFDYNVLSTSTAGVQLKAGIDNALRKLGKEPGQASVDLLLSHAASTVPPSRVHYKDNNIDYEATMADKNEYASKVAKAKQEMIEKLVSGNTTAIAEALAQSGNVRAEEQQKYDLAGQKTDSFHRAVSKDEAARVRVLNETVDDVINAKSIGGFEGDYGAAVAKAKADGSVNKDAIVANLIAMGTVPSNKAVFVKSILDANGNITGDIWNQVKGTVAQFVVDEGKRNKWYAGTIDNMNSSIYRNGGVKRGGVKRGGGSPGASGGGVKDDLRKPPGEVLKGKGKGKGKPTKKAW